MDFARPEFLLLLPLALLQVPLSLRSTGQRRWASAGLRLGCALAIVIALARPMVARVDTAAGPTIVVVDLGPNATPAAVTTAARLARSSGATLVGFSNRSEVIGDPATLDDPARLAEVASRLARPLWPDDRPAGGSALAAALQQAGAILDPSGGGSIELVSNGLSTRGDAEAEAYRLARRSVSIRVTATPVRTPSSDAPIVRAVQVPATTHLGQTARVVVTVESARARRADVSVTVGGGRVVRATVDLAAGLNPIGVDVPVDRAGLTSLQAAVASGGPTPQAGLVPQAATFVDGANRALLVQPSDAPGGVADALRRSLKDGVDLRTMLPAELTRASLDGVGVLVLADTPAAALSPAAAAAIGSATGEGMGLLVAGAANSFGPGGYDGSALDPLLPVHAGQRVDRVSLSAAVVLIVDTSASMQGEKLDLAKDVARLAIAHLEPQDKVGLVEFFGGKRWAAPLQSAANAAVIDRALARLTAGGGTTLYPAVEEAAFALRNVVTAGKHVLILSDGFVEDAPFAALARQMADDGVSVSAVAVKADPHERNLMPALAVWGRGRYYTVPDRFAVPDIALKRPTVAPQPPLVTVPTAVSSGTDALLRDGQPESRGNVDGYVRTTAKATADVLLRTASGDPILARWRYGAGWCAALTTQLGSAYTADLQGRPEFAQLLAGLFRQIGGGHRGRLRLRPTVRPAGVELDVAGDGTRGPIHITLSDEHGHVAREVDVEPIAEGHWNTLVVGLPSGVYVADAHAADRLNGTCGFAVEPPPAVPALSPDLDLLARLERFQPLATQDRSAQRARHWIDLTRPAELLAMALLVLHVGWRRWPARPRSLPKQVQT